MKRVFWIDSPKRRPQRIVFLLLAFTLVLACAVPSSAQKDKKKKNASQTDEKLALPMSDEQQIEYLISEMLGAWQIGDTERMHKDYADDVIVVNGTWAPPVFGWANYVAAYQQQRARMQQVRLDRINTYTKIAGNFAWACYQWDFSGVVDGQPSAARGQTTLILEKRADHWLIVHNHTSLASTSQPVAPASTTQVRQP
ncbi:MAG TPA: nuclear transport factor 2 family protein [Candidatus Methylomirabilis sp.]|nr:nuclear transport factor 2 family protein [Candidatus Methylomirabilis sp.]